MTRGKPSPYPVYLDTAGVHRKHCPGCGEERDIDRGEFAERANPRGTGIQYMHVCKACRAEMAKERRRANLEESRERERLYRRRYRRRLKQR